MFSAKRVSSGHEILALLNCRRLPARLRTGETAVLLGFQEHDIAPLIAANLLAPLGKPAPNAPKYFATVDVSRCCTRSGLALAGYSSPSKTLAYQEQPQEIGSAWRFPLRRGCLTLGDLQSKFEKRRSLEQSGNQECLRLFLGDHEQLQGGTAGILVAALPGNVRLLWNVKNVREDRLASSPFFADCPDLSGVKGLQRPTLTGAKFSQASLSIELHGVPHGSDQFATVKFDLQRLLPHGCFK